MHLRYILHRGYIAGLGYGSGSEEESGGERSELSEQDGYSDSDDDDLLQDRIRRKRIEFEKKAREREEQGSCLKYSCSRA